MTLHDDLENYASSTFRSVWRKRDGQKVPDTSDLSLSNDAVLLDGVVLYADLADSTGLVSRHTAEFAAEVYKTYLYCASRIITSCGGVITAYDGDRVMAVFIDGAKNTNAAKAALKIFYAVRKVVQPALDAQYPNSSYEVSHRVGIDASELLVARTGIRGSNDLVWVGNAANRAAKLSALKRSWDYATYITSPVYSSLLDESKYGGASAENMWKDLGSADMGFGIYGSNWHWKV